MEPVSVPLQFKGTLVRFSRQDFIDGVIFMVTAEAVFFVCL